MPAIGMSTSSSLISGSNSSPGRAAAALAVAVAAAAAARRRRRRPAGRSAPWPAFWPPWRSGCPAGCSAGRPGRSGRRCWPRLRRSGCRSERSALWPLLAAAAVAVAAATAARRRSASASASAAPAARPRRSELVERRRLGIGCGEPRASVLGGGLAAAARRAASRTGRRSRGVGAARRRGARRSAAAPRRRRLGGARRCAARRGGSATARRSAAATVVGRRLGDGPALGRGVGVSDDGRPRVLLFEAWTRRRCRARRRAPGARRACRRLDARVRAMRRTIDVTAGDVLGFDSGTEYVPGIGEHRLDAARRLHAGCAERGDRRANAGGDSQIATEARLGVATCIPPSAPSL